MSNFVSNNGVEFRIPAVSSTETNNYFINVIAECKIVSQGIQVQMKSDAALLWDSSTAASRKNIERVIDIYFNLTPLSFLQSSHHSDA